MGLEDIAATLGTTTQTQESRGVPTVDATEASLTDRLQPYADDLPCTPTQAATLLRTHTTGTPLDTSADTAGLPPVTAAKTLHRLGIEGVCPLTPTARDIVRDWIDGTLTRTEAQSLIDTSPEEFALAAYIETHDPLPGTQDVTEFLQAHDGDAMVEKRDHLGETMTDATDLY